MTGYKPWEVSHFFSREISRRMPSKSCLGPLGGRVMTNFVKHVFFAKVGKVWESDPLSSDPLSSDPVSSDPLSSDPLSSDPLSSDPLSSDPLSSDPLSSDPLSSDIETTLFRAGTKTVQKWYISTKALQKRYKTGTQMKHKLYKSDVQNDKRGFHQRAPNKTLT